LYPYALSIGLLSSTNQIKGWSLQGGVSYVSPIEAFATGVKMGSNNQRSF